MSADGVGVPGSAAASRIETPLPIPGPSLDPALQARVDEYLARGRDTSAEQLIEALRGELTRQYERGYHDGWAGRIQRDARTHERSVAGRTFSHRVRRRMRRRLRTIWNTNRILKAMLMLVLVIVMSGAGAYAAIAISGVAKHYTPVTIPR